MTRLWQKEYRKKFIEPCDLASFSNQLRKEGKRIVTLNGSFDLLHAGHLQTFYEASLLGDVLIVALNSDLSIKGYKGENRPIIPLEGRLQMVAALEFVDHVTYFDALDPREILAQIKPLIHVNCESYGMACIEREVVEQHGGTIHLVKKIPGLSTTEIIQKIVNIEGDKQPCG